MLFITEIDVEFIALGLSLLFVSILIFSYIFSHRLQHQRGSQIILVLTVALGVLFPTSSLMFTSYQLTDEGLYVRSGIFQWTIPYADIQGITPRNSLLPAPALSYNRLEIRYKNASIQLSPNNRERFIQILNEHRARAQDEAISNLEDDL